MCDGDIDFCGGDFTTYDGHASWGRVLFKLVILYVMVGFFCWEELYFRRSGISVNAQVEIAGNLPRGGFKVRYRFIAPDTGQSHFNTVTVREDEKPVGNTATVQYIPGENSRSRLASQAQPGMVTFFVWWNGIMAAVVVGYIGYAAWEYHHIPDRHLSPRDRALARFRRRRKMEREFVR